MTRQHACARTGALSGILGTALFLSACAGDAPYDLLGPGAGEERPLYDLVEDVTPPVLVSATVSPTEVDASAGPVTLTFHFEATDDLSGVQSTKSRNAQRGTVRHSPRVRVVGA